MHPDCDLSLQKTQKSMIFLEISFMFELISKYGAVTEVLSFDAKLEIQNEEIEILIFES